MSSRIFRIGRWIVLGLVLLPSMLVLGVSFALKLTQLSDEPFEQIIMVVGGGLASTAICAVTGCEPEFLEGMESLVFAEGLLEGTPVALEVDEWGRVLVAETARQNAGAEDNRGHPYWLMDDLASRTDTNHYRRADANSHDDPASAPLDARSITGAHADHEGDSGDSSGTATCLDGSAAGKWCCTGEGGAIRGGQGPHVAQVG